MSRIKWIRSRMPGGNAIAAAMAVAFAGVVTSASARPLPAQAAEHSFTIDGDTLEQAYVAADWSDKFTVMDPESKEVNGLYLAADKKFTDCRTRASVFFDVTNMYVCVLAPCPADVSPRADDCVELHLRPGGKKGRVVYMISSSVDGKVTCGKYDAKKMRSGAWAPAGVRAAALRVGKSYTVEFMIPFAAFGAGVSAASEWTCNIIRKGASCGGQSSLAPTNREQPDPGKFIRLAFGPIKEEKQEPPLKENLGKRLFIWNCGPWANTKQYARPPLDKPEVDHASFSGYSGARAVCALRVSNLSSQPAMYNIHVHSGNPEYEKRLRLREMGYLELRGGEVIPDPIFELPIGSVLRIPPGGTAILWIDVDCTGLAVGRYRASLRFMPSYSKFEEKKVVLDLHVGRPDLSEIDIPVFYYAQSHHTASAPLAKDYDFNVNTIIPQMHYRPPDENGNYDFSVLDKKIAAYAAAGMPKERMRIMLYSMFPGWAGAGWTREENKRMPFLSPEWRERYGARVKAVVKHLREKHGIGYDRILVSTLDEPKGDPDDPTTRGYAAIKGGEFIKSVDPNLRIFCNPWANEPQYLQRYLDLYDVLEPYIRRLMDGTEDMEIARRYRDSGKYIASYVIYVKQNSLHQYRRPFWSNLNYGFDGTAAVYGLTAASGDQFNSYDLGKGGKSYSDWNAGYRNPRTGQITPGRRLESWYQGLVDFKLVLWCRRRITECKAAGKDMSSVEQRIAALIRESDMPHSNLEESRAKLDKIAESLVGAKPVK